MVQALVASVDKVAAAADDTSVRHLVRHGDVYAFGVAQGHNMQLLSELLPGRKIWGFDSFDGLPEEDNAASRIEVWKRGMFKAQATPEKLVESAGGAGRARAIKGFFKDSLTPTLAKAEGMRPAAFVDIDCDLHESTLAALDWLFRERIVRPGTLIGYDDWWTIPCHKRRSSRGTVSPMDVGEGLAHREIAQRYGVRFQCVAGPCKMPPTMSSCHQHNNWGPIFIVKEVGAATPADGFEFTAAQVDQWALGVRTCRNIG